MPTQQFVGNTTRRLDLTCPIYHPNLTTFWFWNGILLDNATEQNLTRTSDDQVSLHGVYQCYVGLSDGQEFVAQSDLVTVTRVMPFGTYVHIHVCMHMCVWGGGAFSAGLCPWVMGSSPTSCR